MYGLDSAVDIGFLVGRKVEQICVGEFQSEVRFDDDVILSVESAVTVGGFRYDETRGSTTALVSLLGTRVTAAKNPGTGDIELTMTNGMVLIVHDSKREYESYSVTWKKGTLVV